MTLTHTTVMMVTMFQAMAVQTSALLKEVTFARVVLLYHMTFAKRSAARVTISEKSNVMMAIQMQVMVATLNAVLR